MISVFYRATSTSAFFARSDLVCVENFYIEQVSPVLLSCSRSVRYAECTQSGVWSGEGTEREDPKIPVRDSQLFGCNLQDLKRWQKADVTGYELCHSMDYIEFRHQWARSDLLIL